MIQHRMTEQVPIINYAGTTTPRRQGPSASVPIAGTVSLLSIFAGIYFAASGFSRDGWTQLGTMYLGTPSAMVQTIVGAWAVLVALRLPSRPAAVLGICISVAGPILSWAGVL